MKKNIPFIEKYKPRSIDDLIVDQIIKTKINSIISSKEIPNMILTGKHGIGKTSTVHRIIKTIYHKKNIQDAIIELNSSDERGIKVIQEKILFFCKTKVHYVEGYAQHKLVILDEADSIAEKSQKSLKSIMEMFPDTKFVFICNTSTDIIESIQSRCVIIRFSKPPLDRVLEKLELICNNENIKYEKNALKLLFDYSDRDIRQTFNMLEKIYYSSDDDEKSITMDNINELCDIPPQLIMKDILECIIKRDIRGIFNNLETLKNDGYYSQDILLHFIQYLQNYIDSLQPTHALYDILMNIINNLAYSAYTMSKTTPSYLKLCASIIELVNSKI